MYGVVRAFVGFAIQSGPPRFAPYPGWKGPWAREARGFVLAGAPVGRVKGLGGGGALPWASRAAVGAWGPAAPGPRRPRLGRVKGLGGAPECPGPPSPSVRSVRSVRSVGSVGSVGSVSVWVPSWAGSVRVTGWGYISSGCSSGSHTTFHASPRGRPWTPLRQGHPYIHPGHPTGRVSGSLLVGALARWTWGPAIRRQRTAPHRPPRQPRGPGEAPRTPAYGGGTCPPLAGSLPSAAPPICPSFAANWRMLRAYWDRLPERLSPSPLARGGPPRGGSVPSEPTPTARPISLAHHASHRRPQAHAESPAVRLYRPTATSRRHHRSARRPPTTHHAPVKVKQAQAHVPAQSLPPCHAIDHIHIGRRGPLPHGLTDPRWPRMVRANVPRSQLGSQGHDHAHKVGHRRPAGRVLPSPPSLPTGEDRASTVPQARRGPGAPLGHPVPGITTPQATQGPGRATHHRPSPPFPSNTVNWQRAGHIGIAPPGTQALRLTLSGQGPRPAHPANWRQVLDVERRPSSTGDARGRSLGVGPPPSARRCRGTLMGRCVLHKSSQGSG